MKAKITVIAILLLLSLVCTSCVKEENKLQTEAGSDTACITSNRDVTENSFGENTFEAQTEKKPPVNKQVIYYSSSLEDSYDYLSKYISENVELRPYDSRFESSDITVIKRADAPAQASITLDGKHTRLIIRNPPKTHFSATITTNTRTAL